MNMGESLRRNALKFPKKLAVSDERGELTYAELNARVNRLANSLQGIGLNKDDHVAVLLGNRSEHVEVLFALAKAGLVGLPLDPKWRGREISAAIKFFDVAGIVAETSAVGDAVSQLEFHGPIVQVVGHSGRVTFLNELKGVQCAKLETPAFKPHPSDRAPTAGSGMQGLTVS